MPNVLGNLSPTCMVVYRMPALTMLNATAKMVLIGSAPTYVRGAPTFVVNTTTGFITNPTTVDIYLEIFASVIITPTGAAISSVGFNNQQGLVNMSTASYALGNTVTRTMPLGTPNSISTSFNVCLPPTGVFNVYTTQTSGYTQTAEFTMTIRQIDL